MKRRSKRGHFCWCCGRMRANEQFSGRGHARHVCKECSKLGEEDLAYRRAVRDIDRLVDWDGVVRRRQRKSFERFLSHLDERIRRYAREVAVRGLMLSEHRPAACEPEEGGEDGERATEGRWPGGAKDTKMGIAMRVLKAHVRGGQLVVDEPVDLPEGAEVRVVLVDDELDDAERAELEAALEQSEAELDAGQGATEDELWARLRALR